MGVNFPNDKPSTKGLTQLPSEAMYNRDTIINRLVSVEIDDGFW